MPPPSLKTRAAVQDELPFSSVLSHEVFPGRTVLYVHEVAAAWGVDEKHVCDLMDEGRLKGFNVAGAGNKTSRKFRRIPVSAYDAFVRENACGEI